MKKILRNIMAVSLCTVLMGGTTISLTNINTDNSIVARAASVTEDGFQYTVKSDGTAEITGYTGSETNIVIPSEIDEKTVTSIGESAFRYRDMVTSVTIPNSVTDIGSWAFEGCEGLTNITIPDSVISIGYKAFSRCSKLTNINVDKNNINYGSLDGILYNKDSSAIIRCPCRKTSITIPNSVTYIEGGAFEDCTGLTSITIPNGVTVIGSEAFLNCTGLTSITIPDSVTSIGGSAFQYCGGLTSVTIPDSVEYIGACAFSGCSGLKTITIPDSVTTIEYGAFENCKELTAVTIPEGVTYIETNAFKYCTSLTSITIPNNVTGIGSSAFNHCTGLIKITIPDSVTSIGESAFRDCTGLTSVTIPGSVTSIESGAFLNCISLTDVIIPDSVTNIGSKAFGYYYDDSGWRTFKYPAFVICGKTGSACETYAENNDIEFIDISDGLLKNLSVTSEKEAFTNSYVTIVGGATGGKAPYTYEYYYKKSAEINWTKVDGYSTDKLKTFKPTSVGTYIVRVNVKDSTGQIIQKDITLNVKYEFEYTDSESTITITNYKGNAETVNIPSEIDGKKVTSIGDKAFSSTSIGYDEFYKRSTIKRVTIPDTVTSIGNYAFYDCGELKTVTIGNSVTSIGDDAFGNCSGLTSVDIPSSVNSIGCYAFCWCSNLTCLTIQDGLESIEDYAFYQCKELKNITIPETVISIGKNAIGFFSDSYHMSPTAIVDVKIYGVIGSAAETYANKNGFTFIEKGADVAVTGITMSKSSITIEKGNTETLTATVLPENATDKTVTWLTSNKKVAKVKDGVVTAIGSGTCTISAKSSNGKKASCNVTVKIPTLNNTSVINSDIVQVGDKVRISASANGGTAPYTYAYYYKRSTNSAWKTLGTEFGTNTSVAFAPTAEADFDVKVIVKDSAGQTSEKLFTVQAVKELELTNVSVVGRQKVNLGTAIPMIGKAVGGSGEPYTYSFYFKRSANTNWKLLGDKFQTTASARFKPTATGTYDIRIDVKDSAGTIVKKFFTAEAK